jgi:hypothetical protein
MAFDHFRVVYDGSAVEDGEMDVSQLASSLLALGKLIENADAVRTGEPGRVKVRVFSGGSSRSRPFGSNAPSPCVASQTV